MWGSVSSWLKRTDCEADHSFLFKTKFKNAWSSFTTPYVPSCCTQRDFTFIGIVYKVKIEHCLLDFHEIRYESSLEEVMMYALVL